MSKINNSKSEIRLPVIIAVALSAGIFIGASFIEPSPRSNDAVKSMAKFKEVLLNIDKNYVDDVNSGDIVDDAIVRMLDDLDPHSIYISKEEVDQANSRIKGSYQGIGIQFDIIRDTVWVVKTITGGPAEEIGLKSGDRIVTVENENIAGIGLSLRGVTERLLGPSGSRVNITVLRKGENLDYDIKRGKIKRQTLDTYYMIDNETGYIKLTAFGTTSHDEFRSAMNDLIDQGMSQLILDLQDNPGGLMSAAQSIADEMIGSDRLIVSQKSSKTKYNSSYSAKIDGLFEENPVIVLVNENSASASEIVAGALQDNDRGLIVGRRTYGKGLVQMPITLNDKSEIRLTIARYYTPSGRSIQKPYGDGDDYHSELGERFEHGEYFSKDSIKFDDSLKYVTKKGRIVYGGGGIMPDYFVPYDTSEVTDYYRELFAKRVLRAFSIDYLNRNHEILTKISIDDFETNFELNPEDVERLKRLGIEYEVEYNQDEFDTSVSIIENMIKTEIASLIWDEQGYYRMMNETDTNEILNEALKLFAQAKVLAEAD